MIQELNWKSLQGRRTVARLTMMHKINTDQLPLTVPEKFIPVNDLDRPVTRSNRPHQFINHSARTNIYKNSFYPRTIKQWNLLPRHTITKSTSTESFTENVWSFMNNKDNAAKLYKGMPASCSCCSSTPAN